MLLFLFWFVGSSNIERVALPVRGELVLDSHDACNQMSLVNHYGGFRHLPFFLEDRLSLVVS